VLSQPPVEELIARVQNRAASSEPRELVAALVAEIDAVRQAHHVDPARWEQWADGVDVLGSAFEALMPGADRRAAGQFLTPFWAADLMADWILEEPVRTLCDPAVGSGRLLFRAARKPGCRPERVLGIDADPNCLAMAEVNLELRGIEERSLLHRNFLLDDIGECPDALICNPPYSRHHTIPAEEKAAIHEGFDRRLGLRLSRLAGLHVLFLLRALELTAPGARIAFITPAEWLDVNYGRAVKQFVLRHAHVDALVILRDDHLLFDGALTTAAITLLRKRMDGESSQEPTKIVHLPGDLPDGTRVLAALRGEKTSLKVDEATLGYELKWSRRPVGVRRGRPLGELARVRRGVATGCNRFFVISEAMRRERGLELDVLRPCITTPRLLERLEFDQVDLDALDDDVPRWIIDCCDPAAEGSNAPIGEYLRWGRDSLQASAGYLASRRTPWYSLEQRAESPILFTYMNRQQPRFIRNRAGAVPLNTFLIVEPIAGVDSNQLWQALNDHAFIEQLRDARRSYGGGLWKIEPKELEALTLDERSVTTAQLALV
jgi:adenine-specific DNA-methyltransferase